MKHFSLSSMHFATLMTAAVCTLPLNATEPIRTPWNQVCSVAGSNHLTITKADGDSVEGYCLSVNADEIAVTTKDKQIVKIARAAVSRVHMRRSKGHNLRSLGDELSGGLRFGFESLLSPLAPVGIVAIPATLAWGAVAAPFCLLGDLKDKISGDQEINVI